MVRFTSVLSLSLLALLAATVTVAFG